MTAPIKTCDYCGATGEMPSFMDGETICYTCLHVLPKTLPEARQELMRLRAVLAVVAQPAPSVPDTYAAGINAVAAMLQSKADEYAKEHGHDDMGGLSFGSGMGGEIKMDYYTNLIELVDDVRAMLAGAPNAPSVPDGWKEAAIAWEVCASIHREYGKGKDPFFNTRQGDFVKHANDARAMLAGAPEAKP